MDAKKLREYRKLRHRMILRGQLRIGRTPVYKALDAEFRAFLSGIEDPVERKIMELYYRDVRSNIYIGDILHYSESQVRRIRRRVIYGEERN